MSNCSALDRRPSALEMIYIHSANGCDYVFMCVCVAYGVHCVQSFVACRAQSNLCLPASLSYDDGEKTSAF